MTQEKDIEINGQRLHYAESGNADGLPIVLMHGWGCDHTTVRSIAACLEGERHIYSLDLPGHGKSDEPQSVWGVDEYAEIVGEFINKVVKGERKGVGVGEAADAGGVKREGVTLIGHSYGGRIAIMLGAQRSDIDKIVLVDAAGIKPKRSLKYYVKVYSYKIMKRVLPLVSGRKLGEKLLDRYRGKAGSADYRMATPRMRAVMSRSVNQDLRSYMPAIKAPTLLIWGRDDKATPLSDAEKMGRLIPNAGLVVFDGCGHYSFLDNPFGFRSVIRKFLV